MNPGSGTSFSAPHVSGTLALMVSATPGLSPTEAIDLLKQTAEDLGKCGCDCRFGAEPINANQAVVRAT